MVKKNNMSEGGVTTSTFWRKIHSSLCSKLFYGAFLGAQGVVWLFTTTSRISGKATEVRIFPWFFGNFARFIFVGSFLRPLKTQAETGALLFQWWVESRCLVYGHGRCCFPCRVDEERNKFVGYKIQILWLKISSGSNSEWYLGALWWQRCQGQWKMTGGILQTQKTAQTCNT